MLPFDSLAYLQTTSQTWPSVLIREGRFGQQEFSILGLHEFARLHPNGLLELWFPPLLSAQLIEAGKAKPHPVYTDPTAWVSFAIYGRGDVHRALTLLRLAYLLKRVGLHVTFPSELSQDLSEVGQLFGKLDMCETLWGRVKQLLLED